MFRSIKYKLALSYLLVIITSISVVGFFFHSRMKHVLEESIRRETQDQASILAGNIGALAVDPENIFFSSESVSQRYYDSPDKRVMVYNRKGFLIADSKEPSVGYFNPPPYVLRKVMPNLLGKSPQRVMWRSKARGKSFVLHMSIPVVDANEFLKGILDISVPIYGDKEISIYEERLLKISNNLKDEYLKSLTTPSTIPKLPKPFRVRIYNEKRKLIYSTQIIKEDILDKLKKGNKIYWISDGSKGRLLCVGVPITSSLSRIYMGSLIFYTSLRSIDEIYNHLRSVLFYAIGVSMGVTLIVSFILAFSLIHPISRIKEATLKIAGGDYSVKVDYKGQDEIRSLVDAINEMSDRIRENLKEITDEKDKMNALLSALPDGVIALNYNGEILFLNESASKMLKINKTSAGKNIQDVVGEPPIIGFFKEGRTKHGIFTKEIPLPPKILKFYLIRYGTKGEGIMMVVRDVTDLRRLEETRTRFLGSISHELRTPLTVIKGFIHNIMDEDEVKKREDLSRMLQIIDGETDRLARLVNDLLELSRLRSKKLSLEMETVNLDSLTEETVTQMELNAKRVGINLLFTPQTSNTEVMADKDRIKQVIINLIDNGIKYTPSGGKVEVSTYIKDNHWILEVKDTGLGISKEELPFLFERFYRTKDRKKKKYIKGTGLGMAIVKEIVDAHKGKITVESQEGKGTKILVSIPLT